MLHALVCLFELLSQFLLYHNAASYNTKNVSNNINCHGQLKQNCFCL